MAQLVEHNLAKVGVAGSSPVFRSMLSQEPASQSALLLKARNMATWPSGKAEACKAFITGSIPVVASIDSPSALLGRFFRVSMRNDMTKAHSQTRASSALR